MNTKIKLTPEPYIMKLYAVPKIDDGRINVFRTNYRFYCNDDENSDIVYYGNIKLSADHVSSDSDANGGIHETHDRACVKTKFFDHCEKTGFRAFSLSWGMDDEHQCPSQCSSVYLIPNDILPITKFYIGVKSENNIEYMMIAVSEKFREDPENAFNILDVSDFSGSVFLAKKHFRKHIESQFKIKQKDILSCAFELFFGNDPDSQNTHKTISDLIMKNRDYFVGNREDVLSVLLNA